LRVRDCKGKVKYIVVLLKGMRRMWALLLLLIVAASFAGTGTIKVAAVDGEGRGQSLDMGVEVVPGKGRVLITSVPFTGVDTQASENVAVRVAVNYTGAATEDKDIIFIFHTNATLVEGSSAGGAMALATISALEGREIRDDLVMTGGIAENGDITMVGAILVKAHAARNQTLFLVPPGGVNIVSQINTVREKGDLVLNEVDAVVINLTGYADRHWGLNVIEVYNISHAEQIAFSRAEPRNLRERNRTFVLAENEAGGGGFLLKTAVQFREEARLLAEAYAGRDGRLKDVLENLEKSEKYAGMGYAYPGANYAFLARLNAKTVQDIAENVSWPERYRELKERAAGFELPESSDAESIPYLVAARERYAWAEYQIKVMDNVPSELNESFFRANLIDTWLDIAEMMADEVTPGSYRLGSEAALLAERRADLAAQEIAADQALGIDVYGGDQLLNSVKFEQSQGWYYAAVYDAINSEARAGSGFAGKQDAIGMIEDAEVYVEEAEKRGFGMWARLYLGNAKVSLAEGNVREAYSYAFMAREYSKVDLELNGYVIEEREKTQVLVETKKVKVVERYWLEDVLRGFAGRFRELLDAEGI